MDAESHSADEIDRIRSIAGRVLEDEAFKRSPILARLLQYLVEKTAAGETITSFSIAFDGLGKSYADNAEADTYARVTVARLRKALAVYFRHAGADEAISIDLGTYQVRAGHPVHSGENGLAQTAFNTHAALRRRLAGKSRGIVAAIVLAVLVLISGLGYLAYRDRQADMAKWNNPNYPKLQVSVESMTTGGFISPQEIVIHLQDAKDRLKEYNAIYLIEPNGTAPDYEARITFNADQGEVVESWTLVEVASHNVVWSETYPVQSGKDLKAIVDTAVESIASPNGALMVFLRSKGYRPDTPLGCWLRFTEGVQTFNTGKDAELKRCAREWYENAPNRPLAAFLYGWTLVDLAAQSPTQSDRAAKLGSAFQVLRRAIALNPERALLYIANMRANALAGDRQLVLTSAHDAIRSAPHNPVVVGMAASNLVLWGDPEGERILDRLDTDEGASRPWEHVGRFVAAMMREDTVAAGEEASELEQFDMGQPLMLIIEAAYASRVGRADEAKAALDQLRAYPAVRFIGVNAVIDRLPISPEVRRKLRQWLPRNL